MILQDYLISKDIDIKSFITFIDSLPQSTPGYDRGQNWRILLSREYATTWMELNKLIELRIKQYLEQKEGRGHE